MDAHSEQIVDRLATRYVATDRAAPIPYGSERLHPEDALRRDGGVGNERACEALLRRGHHACRPSEVTVDVGGRVDFGERVRANGVGAVVRVELPGVQDGEP